jgi:hypothetical protein
MHRRAALGIVLCLAAGCGAEPVSVDAGPGATDAGPVVNAPRLEFLIPTGGHEYTLESDDLDGCYLPFGPVHVRVRVLDDPFRRVRAVDFRTNHCMLDPTQNYPHVYPIERVGGDRIADGDIFLTCLDTGASTPDWVSATGLTWEDGTGVAAPLTRVETNVVVTVPATVGIGCAP